MGCYFDRIGRYIRLKREKRRVQYLQDRYRDAIRSVVPDFDPDVSSDDREDDDVYSSDDGERRVSEKLHMIRLQSRRIFSIAKSYHQQ